MSDMHHPESTPPAPPNPTPSLTVIPVRAAPPPRPSGTGEPIRFLFWVCRLVILAGLLLVLFLVCSGVLGTGLSEDALAIHEHFHSGKKTAKDKIAVVKVEGVISELTTQYAQKQIEAAAKDDAVKAVILRINSPGGTITASDDLHHKLVELRDGDPAKKTHAKTLLVSMDSLAASGGYYIAMPAKYLLAERTTITGSIGVYAAFPNISGLAKKYGFGMEVIKKGEVKDSGSMFHEMTPEERQVWQDMVDHAFHQFLAVVEDGRPDLKGKLRQPLFEKTMKVPEEEKARMKEEGKKVEDTFTYTRRLADGGIFTSEEAVKYGLIDKIGYLEDAIAEAKKMAGLGDDYKAITYDRPTTLSSILLEAKAPAPGAQFDPGRLALAATPRLWYLAPQSELAGLLAAFGKD